MTIAITTPTGHVGSRVVRLLVQAGVRPVLLLRDPDKLDPETRALVDLCQGDLGDADYVLRATEGVDALFWVDPTDFSADDPNAETVRLGAHAAAAVVKNRIARVVLQSSVGAERRSGAGLIDGLAEVERQLDHTGVSVVNLRCGYFFVNLLGALDSLRSGVLPTSNDPDQPMPWVDPRDIGDVVAARLLSDGWSGTVTQAVHGPADLTFREVAEILTDATGRRIRLELLSDDDQRRGLLEGGLSPRAADGVLGMTSGLRAGFVPEQPRTVVTTTPTTLAAWAHAHLRPLLG